MDRLSKNIPAENQMRDISLSRKSAEHVMFMNAKRKNYHKIRSANENQTRYCNICSEFIMQGDYTSSIVHHTHNSSKDYRISSPADRWGNYPCITCKSTPHSHKIGVRYPVLVSSSILNNWQGIRSMKCSSCCRRSSCCRTERHSPRCYRPWNTWRYSAFQRFC